MCFCWNRCWGSLKYRDSNCSMLPRNMQFRRSRCHLSFCFGGMNYHSTYYCVLAEISVEAATNTKIAFCSVLSRNMQFRRSRSHCHFVLEELISILLWCSCWNRCWGSHKYQDSNCSVLSRNMQFREEQVQFVILFWRCPLGESSQWGLCSCTQLGPGLHQTIALTGGYEIQHTVKRADLRYKQDPVERKGRCEVQTTHT